MHNVLFTVGPFTIYGYGLMIAIGAVLAIYLSCRRAKNNGLDSDLTFSMTLWGLIFGLLGAKLTFWIANFKEFIHDPLSMLNTEGYVVYGGIILGVVVGLLRGKLAKVSLLDYSDIIIPQIPLAQGFGRIGCFLAGCCYGMPTDSEIGVFFPMDSMAPSGVNLLPTQLFSAFGDWILFALMLWFTAYRKKYNEVHPDKLLPKGIITCLYPIFYGIGRFIMEFLRGDPRTMFGPFTSNQYVSMLLIALGVGFVIYLMKNKKTST